MAIVKGFAYLGISEPDVDSQMKAYTGREEQIKVMTLVHDGIVTINIIVSATTRENAVKNFLMRVEQDIRKNSGPCSIWSG